MHLITVDKDSDEDLPRDQFVSLSMDGQLLFWSLDFNDPKEKKKISLEETDFQSVVWRAILQIQLF